MPDSSNKSAIFEDIENNLLDTLRIQGSESDDSDFDELESKEDLESLTMLDNENVLDTFDR